MIVKVPVAKEVIASTIARDIVEVGGRDFTIATAFIEAGVTATTMHVAIFAPGARCERIYCIPDW